METQYRELFFKTGQKETFLCGFLYYEKIAIIINNAESSLLDLRKGPTVTVSVSSGTVSFSGTKNLMSRGHTILPHVVLRTSKTPKMAYGWRFSSLFCNFGHAFNSCFTKFPQDKKIVKSKKQKDSEKI